MESPLIDKVALLDIKRFFDEQKEQHALLIEDAE
jgi:hypothetical protein